MLYYKRYTIVEGLENSNWMTGMNASEACQKISSRAEEIQAEYDGIEGIIRAFQGPFNPRNWSSENVSNDMLRNIVNTNLSSEERTKVLSDCANSALGAQMNIIDTTNCEYCQKFGCNISNIKQLNKSELEMTCQMQSIIQILLTKKNSVDAQALAQTLQKAQGILSGTNISTSENCNIVNTDMSSDNYLESLSSCSNTLAIDQTNSITNCGSATNIVQENQYKAFQNCLVSQGTIVESKLESDTTATAESKKEQTAMGLALDTTTSAILFVICCSSVISIAIGGMMVMFGDESAPSRLPITKLPVAKQLVSKSLPPRMPLPPPRMPPPPPYRY